VTLREAWRRFWCIVVWDGHYFWHLVREPDGELTRYCALCGGIDPGEVS
jgi:hypothetical protein